MKNKFADLFSKTEIWLFLSFALVIMAKFWEPGIGISSATYGALAKNILRENNWLAPRLAPHIYDPFVEHPYLVLWMDAIFMKIFGITSQVMRLASITIGLAGVMGLFSFIKKTLDERTALISCILLLVINVFMNFFNSGWLDMPMVGFTLIAFALAAHQRFGWSGFLRGLLFSQKVLALWRLHL